MSSTLIFVLGMHLSGTSLTARALNAIGAELGDRLMPPNHANPTGYWEDLDVVECNDQLLNELALSWDTPTIDPFRCVPASELARFKGRVRGVLERKTAGVSRLALKDPRLCLLFPLWREAARDLGLEIKLVVSVRNPLDVAQSLLARDKLSVLEGLTLWRNHNYLILRHLQGHDDPRVFVDYDRMLDSPSLDLARMSVTVNNTDIDSELPESAKTFVSEFVDKRLRHSLSSTDELEHAASDLGGALRIYSLLQLAARHDDESYLSANFEENEVLRWEAENYKLARNLANRKAREQLQRQETRLRESFKKSGQAQEAPVAAISDAQMNTLIATIKQSLKSEHELVQGEQGQPSPNSIAESALVRAVKQASDLNAKCSSVVARIQALQRENALLTDAVDSALAQKQRHEHELAKLQAQERQVSRERAALVAELERKSKEYEKREAGLQKTLEKALAHERRIRRSVVVNQELRHEYEVQKLKEAVGELTNRTEKLGIEMTALSEAKSQAMTEVTQLRSSLSWRLTGPIRIALDLPFRVGRALRG